MDCSTSQNKLVGQKELSPEVLRHLDGCDECRQLAADLQLMRELRDTSATTPTLLRENTLGRCREMLADRLAARETSIWQRCRRMVDSHQFVAGVAAVALIFLGWWLGTQIVDTQNRETIMSIKLVFIQLVVQNFGAAVLFPLLWWMMFRRQQHLATRSS